MTLNFFKRIGSSGEKTYELDKRKFNHNVIKLDDKQTASYTLTGERQGPSGIVRANLPLASSVPLAYFEVYIVNSGRGHTLAVGLTSNSEIFDQMPGFFKGSMAYHQNGHKVSTPPSSSPSHSHISFLLPACSPADTTPSDDSYGPTYKTGDVIGVGLDNHTNSVFFTKNGKSLGVAFKSVGNVEWFPCVGMKSPGQTIIISFTPPFLFDRSQYGEQIEEPLSTPNGLHMSNYTPDGAIPTWDSTRCGKCISISPSSPNKITVVHDSHYSIIGVAQATRPVSFSQAPDSFSYFEVHVDRLEGQMSLGLANHEYALNLHIGWLKRSYGYHSDDGRKFKWKEMDSSVNDGESYGESFAKGDTIGCGYNVITRQIYFTKNGISLGPAYSNVYGILYPSVALSGNFDSITANFIPPFKYTPSHSLLSTSTSSNGSSAGDADSPVISPLSSISINVSPASVPSSPILSDGINNSNNNNNNTPTPNSMVPGGRSGSIGCALVGHNSPPYSSSPPKEQSISSPNTQSRHLSAPFPLSPLPQHSASPPSPRGSISLLPTLREDIPYSAPLRNSQRSPNSSGLINSPYALSSFEHQRGIAWKKTGKAMKVRDDITLTMIKKKAATAQASRPFLFSQGLCYFEIFIEDMDRKGSCAIGLSNEDYPLNKQIGKETKSYSYSDTGFKMNGDGRDGEDYASTFQSGDVIGCGVSGQTREIFFTRNGEYLGVAFWNVPDIPLYPSVSMKGSSGATVMTSFTPPFKFSVDGLPGVSPSVWSMGVGSSSLDSSRSGYRSWTASDVGVWLEAIGYGTYKKAWFAANICGRHLPGLSHTLLKDELKVDKYGHRADLLNHARKLIMTWKERTGCSEGSDDLVRIDVAMEPCPDSGSKEHDPNVSVSGPGSLGSQPTNPDSAGGSRPGRRETRTDSVGERDHNSHNPYNFDKVFAEEGPEGGWVWIEGDQKTPMQAPQSGGYHPPHIHHNSQHVPHPYSLHKNDMYDYDPVGGLHNDIQTLDGPKHNNSNHNHIHNHASQPQQLQQSQQQPYPQFPSNSYSHPFHTSYFSQHLPPLSSSFIPNSPTSVLPLAFSTSASSGSLLGNNNNNNHNNHNIHNNGPRVRLSDPPPIIDNFDDSPNPPITPTRPASRTHRRSPSDHSDNPTTPSPNPLQVSHPPIVTHTQMHQQSHPGHHVLNPALHSNSMPFLPRSKSQEVVPFPSIHESMSISTTTNNNGLFTTTTTTTTTPGAKLNPAIDPILSDSTIDRIDKHEGSNSSWNLTNNMSTSSLGTSTATSTSTSSVFNSSMNSPTPGKKDVDWEIDYDELQFGEVVGKGFFGEVKRGTWRETDVAIKIIYRDSFKTHSSYEMFQNEVCILSKLRHPNIVQFLGACTSKDHQVIVTEWMSGGSLRQFLQDHFRIFNRNSQLRVKMALDIAKGMTYLHDRTHPILHRDLSSRNILLDLDDPESLQDLGQSEDVVWGSIKCKVADFGLSRLKIESGLMTAAVGCIPYMAPEVYKGESNSERSDVYSYAMVLWELFTGQEPQQEMKPMKMAHLAAHEGYRPVLPLNTPPAWRDLITLCWNSDPEKRPSFKQIILRLKTIQQKPPTPSSITPSSSTRLSGSEVSLALDNSITLARRNSLGSSDVNHSSLLSTTQDLVVTDVGEYVESN